MGTGTSKEQSATAPVAPSAKGLDNDSTVSSSSNSISTIKANMNPPIAPVEETTNTQTTSSRCPMHNSSDGTYKWDLRKAFSSSSFPHWAGGSKPLTKEEARAAATQHSTNQTDSITTEGCPVQRQQHNEGCPVKHTSSSTMPEYNVYAEPVDPSNRMPSTPNQLPAPHQSKQLPTDRVASSIPKVCVCVL